MPPIIDDPVPTIPPVVPHDALCRQCGYRIGTLPRDHNCPECGTPIERSLRGDLLLYSSTEYASSLQRGLTCILIAVVIQIAAGLVSFIAVLIFVWRPLMRQQSDPDAEARIFSLLQQLQLGSQILMLPVAALSLYGWWLFSSPDPAVLGFEHGQTPRVVIRAATIIMAALVLLGVVSQSLVIANSAFTAISYGVGILVGLASIAQFFASLLYIR